MAKEITYKQYLKALKKQKDAELIVSQYNLQQVNKWVANLEAKAKELAHTFQNGHRTEKECITMAKQYIISQKEGDKDFINGREYE